MTELSFSDAIKYLENGDVLLLSPTGIIGNLIAKAGEGDYSHAGIFFWENGKGYITEFKEFHGARTIPIEQARREYWNRMVFFRATPYLVELVPVLENEKLYVRKSVKSFNGAATAKYIRDLEGLSYGWYRIFVLLRRKLPFFRFFFRSSSDDKQTNGHVYPVCSTAVAKAFRETYTDLIPQKADIDVEPSDLARSKVLYLLFRVKE